MKKYRQKHKLIVDLETKLEKGNNSAVDEFLCYIEKNGTPLIEKIEDDTDNSLVTFIYSSSEPLENVLFLSGFLPANLEVLNLEDYKMDQIQGTNLWHITYKVRNDIRFQYYFFPNDSLKADCEKRWDNIKWDKFNKRKLVWEGENGEEDIIYSFVIMQDSQEDFWVKERPDVHKGNLQQYEFESKNFKEPRKTYVYTPYGYSEDSSPYGYIVLTDAYEYINILSSMQAIDNLIADKKIPPIVAVLLDATETRYEELTCNENFCDTIVNELIPWAREKYNISTNPQQAIIGGVSLGGLTASYLGLKHPEVFGNILSKSGSYWYKPDDYEGDENECWMSSQFKAVDKLPLKFYLNVGILEGEWMTNTNADLRDTLEAKGYHVYFETFKSAHDYLSWGETFATGLISLIGI